MRYAYATIQSLRDFGISAIEYPDALARRLIYLYSDRVNKIVEKVFIANEITYNGFFEGSMFKLHGAPIIELKDISFIGTDNFRQSLDTNSYKVNNNKWIRLANMSSDSLNNVEINYIGGIVENPKRVEVELTSPINKDATSFTVRDASKLEPRDVLVFDNKVFIINDIDYSINAIIVDKVDNIPIIPAGTITVCYGQVPYLIEEAVKLFIKHHKALQKRNVMKSEKIGKYQYEMFESGSSTGIAEIDSILSLFINDEFDISFL
jgi:hypothetical protein